MLRLLFPLLLIAPLAQAQVPDTTNPARYAPMAVGNEWHYEERSEIDQQLLRIHVWRVTSDSLINGEQCFRFERRRYEPSGQPWHVSPLDVSYVRFDAEADNLRRCGDEGFVPGEYLPWCPLSADFGSEIQCDEGFEVWVSPPDSIASVGNVQVQTTVKGFDTGGGETYHVFAADLGLVLLFAHWVGITRLTYVRAGDLEYGTPIPVSTEPELQTESALSVFPNPASSVAVVRISVDVPRAARIEVFDLLGRRVLERDLGTLAGGEHEVRLDISGLSGGVYVLRAFADGGVLASTRLTLTR